MLKVSTFLAEGEHGLSVVPLFGPADSVFEKTASAGLLPDVLGYINTLRPRNDAQYVLVNALGAGEYYSSNINADHFPEIALIHKPDNWTGNPLLDKSAARDWPYGFPTFYGAHPFAHHRNKDASRAYGEVELAAWNDGMKRVELVTRVDLDKCQRFGGTGVWDRLRGGQFPDVSMGSKVPWDLCSICGDMNLYQQALATFNPKKHKHPGIAVLEFHKKLKAKDGVGIRGLSITRTDYCEHMRTMPNKILHDGRKVFVYNYFPRFFDISFVFIGADRTAKVMVFITRHGRETLPSALVAEQLGMRDEPMKAAEVSNELLKVAFNKDAKDKGAEIEKEVVPSQFAGKAVPIMTRREPDLSDEAMRALCAVPMSSALSTMTGLGMVLRPSEFQRLALTQAGGAPLADELERSNVLFPQTDEEEPVDMKPESFMPPLARLLQSSMADRSAFGPIIEKRVVVIMSAPERKRDVATSHPTELLRKIGAAYNGYRRGVMDIVANAQDMMNEARGSRDDDLRKLSEASAGELFTPLSYQYLDSAFRDEVPPLPVKHAEVVQTSQRSFPLPAWRGDSPQGSR